MVNFDTYRSMRGQIQLCIWDVTFSDGHQFDWFYTSALMTDNNSNQYGSSGTLTKYWGQDTPFVNIGYASHYTPLALTLYNCEDSYGGGWFHFKADIRWDNYGGTA